jgi:hypothetical protein
MVPSNVCIYVWIDVDISKVIDVDVWIARESFNIFWNTLCKSIGIHVYAHAVASICLEQLKPYQ